MIIVCSALLLQAETTINASDHMAYSANTGWIDMRGDVTNGAIIGEAFCGGYIYSANCGWISLGDGWPDDGVGYGNDSATDFGVNHDGAGNLTGTAYGANIGWINFEQTYGKPRVDLNTGALSGYIYSANCGWISLSNAYAFVKTDTLSSGPDTDADGLPDWWEYDRYGKLNVLNGIGDWDNDGVSDLDEYRADTDPTDGSDYLDITDFQVNGETNVVSWMVKTTRRYTLEHTTSMTNNAAWVEDTTLIPTRGPGRVETITGVTDPKRFYRVKASPPLN